MTVGSWRQCVTNFLSPFAFPLDHSLRFPRRGKNKDPRDGNHEKRGKYHKTSRGKKYRLYPHEEPVRLIECGVAYLRIEAQKKPRHAAFIEHRGVQGVVEDERDDCGRR